MKQHISIIRMMLVVILLVGLFVVVGVASSQSPETAGPDAALVPDAPTSLLFSYQGQLLDTNGDPIPDPTVDMTFKLYDVEELGTACWTEDHTGGDAVDVEEGLFNVLLGQITPLDTACLAGDVYLELVVEGETLSPRELLTSVAHAREANTLSDGATTAGDLTIAGIAHIGEAKTGEGGEIRLAAGTSGNAWHIDNRYGVFRLNHDGMTYFSLTSDGDVGIGTTDPSAKLHINGRVRVDSASASAFRSGDTYIYLQPFDGSGPAAYGRIGVSHVTEGSKNLVLNDDGGKVGIGTTTPSKKLDVAGDVRVGNSLYLGGTDFVMEEYAGRGGGRALVNDTDDILTINYNTDFVGGVRINGPVHCGALVETNLQTIEEQESGRIDRFEEGDVLCWSAETGQLELCTTDNNRLVMAVADANGKPIVMGAEPVKVLGPVLAGDILVSSDIPGYVMVNNDPKPGTVIAQALEDFDGEQGVIKAMIRKW